MTKEEFLKKYHWPPTSASQCHQITWDLIEEMVETFYDTEFETAKGATLYDIDNYCKSLIYNNNPNYPIFWDINNHLLQVIKTDIPDYQFLIELKQDLENTSNL